MSMSKTYDVIVVGLGPGGSSAAGALAALGHRVVAFEKHKMPRMKTCGGCLSARVQSIFDEDLSELAETEITQVLLTFRGQSEIVVKTPQPLAYMVMRDRFDHFLARKAAQAGAEIRAGEPVLRIEQSEDGFKVETVKGSYTGRYLIGADGVNGLTGRALGYGPRRRLAVALEGEVKVRPDVFTRLEHTIRLDLGEIPYGYGWLFPKKDHWSIGVGSVRRLNEHPKKFYKAVVENQNISSSIYEEQRRGYRIPLFAGKKSVVTGAGSLLIGDAAALVDPLLGEGIYYAIRSGQIAAEAIHQALRHDSSDLSAYQQQIEKEIYPEFEVAARIAKFAFHFPRISYALFKARPEVAEAFVHILQGSLSYHAYWEKISRLSKYGLFGFLQLLKKGTGRAAHTYDRVARNYDALLFCWQETAARQALDYYYTFLKQHVKDGATVLDAGTGTGESIKKLLQIAKPGYITGLDISENMLDIARKKVRRANVHFQQGNFLGLPFPDRSFDVVMSSWAIETCVDPRAAVQEFLRVIRQDGYVISVFSTLPRGIKRLYSYAIERVLGGSFDWRFLHKQEQPYHKCRYSSLTTFANGLITVVVLRKCCTVTQDIAGKKLPKSWKMGQEQFLRSTKRNLDYCLKQGD